MTPALILFIKNPREGKVKTRLARTLGDEQALAIYLSLLDRVRRTARLVDSDRLVYYSDFIPEKDDWEETHFQKRLQSGNDLGVRMFGALKAELATHPAAILIGGDVPGITPDIIRDGFEQLTKTDLVFGPAADGGYYLIGMNRPIPEIFEDIPWSTDKVLDVSVQKARQSNLSVSFLPTLQDVDELEDWEKVKYLFGV